MEMFFVISNGIFQPPWWVYIMYVLVMTHITIVTVTIFLHRNQAHGALNLHPIVRHFFRFWLWFTTGMKTKTWVAIHRKHHAKNETEEDPHSPKCLGLKKVLLEGTELYRKEAKNKETIRRYGQGIPNDWLERNLYTRRSGWGVRLMLIVNVALFGVIGVTMWAVQMIWIPFFAAGVINSIGHCFGYRNFDYSAEKNPDYSTNIVPIGIFIGGEELHNNHHEFPNSAKFSVKPWEFDLGWLYIRILEALGGARVKNILGVRQDV